MLRWDLPIGRIINWIILVLCCMVYISCTDNTLTGNLPEKPGTSPDGIPVRVTIRTANQSTGKYTRTQTTEETRISEISVIVYENDRYAYLASGTSISSNATSTTFEVSLKPTTNSVKLCFVANAGDAFPDDWESKVADSTLEQDINMWLEKSFTASGITGDLPMYGVYTLPDGINYENMGEITGVNMLRSVARVDVIVDEAVNNFRMETVQVFRCVNGIRVAPAGEVDYSNPKVSVLTLPTVVGKVDMNAFAVVGNAITSKIYIPESEAATTSEDLTDNALCVVIGGKFISEGSEATMNYYRIDFRTDETVGQVLRNYRYLFRIQAINGNGWGDAATASQRPSGNITTVLEKWDDNQTNEITDGSYFFGFSTRKLSLRFRAGSADYVDIRTNLGGYTLCWVDEKGAPLSAVSGSEQVSDTNFGAQIVDESIGKEGEKLSRIRISALNSNKGNSRITAYLLVNAENRWNITIQVNQLTNGDYNDVIVKILSLSVSNAEYGNLGGSYISGDNGASTAVKPILLNHKNFGTDGVIPIKYIGMDNISRTTSADNLRTTLPMYDILHLMTANTPSAEQSQAIIEWLEGSDNRVLFLSRDRDTNNSNLLSALGSANTWTGGGTAASSGRTFKSAPVIPANDYFLASGPFGAANVSGVESNNTYWRSIEPGSDLYNKVTPLLVSTDDTKGYLVSIDLARRIVYVGHPYLYQSYTGAMGNTGEVANSDLARLFANIYAWAIEEVVIPGKLKLN